MSPRRESFRAGVSLLLRLGLGTLFIIAGLMKMRDPARFALEISNYQLIHTGTSLLAAVLPAMEIVAGLGLMMLPRLWRQAAATVITAMVVMFTVAVGFAYFRGINIDCGCFGGSEGPITGVTVLRNLSLLAAGVCAFWLDLRPQQRSG